MKNKAIKSIALFLISLIINLPIYSSLVLASLSNPHLVGADNIEGYVRRGEDILLNITANIPGDTEIIASQLHLTDSNGPAFNLCTDIGNGNFLCNYIMSSSPITQRQFQLKVILYNDDNVQDSAMPISGIFDELSPEVKSFDIVPTSSNGQNTTIQYNVYDHSYSPTDSNRCTGIKKIEFLSPSKGIFRTIDISSSSNVCEKRGNFNVAINEVTDSEGIIPITLTVYDGFDQVSTALTQLRYDAQPPIINPNSLEIKDNTGNSIDYIGNNPVNNAVVSFKITADDLDTNNVYGSFPEINIDNPSAYENKRAVCNSIRAEEYNCSFTNVQVKINQTTLVNVIINASDLTGNSVSSTLTKNIVFDNTGPSVTSIKTALVDNDGVSYVRNLDNTFIVELNEEGIGLNENQIRLDLSSIKTGLNNKPANSCTGSANVWTCLWNNITSDQLDGNKTISVLASSSDKLGNLVSGTLSAIVVIDKTSPAVLSSNLSALGTGAEAIAGFIKTTDRIEIRTRVRERNKLEDCYADVSSIVTTQGNVSGEIIKEEGDEWRCTFTSNPIDVPGYITTNLPLTFVDFVGNSVRHQQAIRVYNYTTEANPNYWTNVITCSPQLVDRQVTSLVEFKIICSIELIPLTADQSTLSINFENCRDNIAGSTAYLKDATLINNQRESTNPYLSIVLSRTNIRADRIALNCPLNIITKVGTNIMQNPESENVSVNINLYNLPLGELDKNVEKKIKKIKDDFFVGMKWIDILKKILFYAEKLCQIVGLIGKIIELWGIWENLLSGNPIVNTASVAAERASIPVVSFLEKACKWISCDSTLWGNWYTGQHSLWLSTVRTAGRGFAAGGDKEVGAYENWVRKYSLGTILPPTPKDSIIWSIVTGCLPGIIYGIDKWRQIQCNYGVCLFDSAENNIPIKVCEDQKSYMVCKFVFGEIFQLVPLYWLRQLGQYVASILSDPIALVFGFVGFLCDPMPKLHGFCAWARGIAISLEVLGDIQGLLDSKSWKIQNDMCKVFFERAEKLTGEDDDGGWFW